MGKKGTKNNRKVIKKASGIRSLTKDLMEKALKHIASEIVAAKPNIDGRTPRGFAETLLKEAQSMFPALTMNKINYAVKNLKEALKKGALNVNSSSKVSSLTGDSESDTNINYNNVTTSKDDDSQSATSNDSTATTDSRSNASNSSAASKSSIDSSSMGKKKKHAPKKTTSIKSYLKSLAECDSKNEIGRPKGSTDAYQRDLMEKVEKATQEAVSQLKEVKSKSRSSKHRLEKGSLNKIISTAKEKYSNTVRQRLKRGSTCGHVGHKSPMLEVEPYLVELIKKLCEMRTPITTAQGLELANSLVEGKSIEKSVLQWKAKNCHAYKLHGIKKLGKSYWNNFLKRNRHLIRAKKAVKFESKRSEWCNYLNMDEMYEEIYKNLCLAGLACEHPEPVWRDKNGEAVESEEQAFGCKSQFELIHPDHLIFVDEVGSNTSQTKDGNVGGQTFLCTADGRPQSRAATKDAHFTVLGFTAANGEPLLCAIIFAAKTLKKEWVSGFDPFAEWIGNEDNIAENSGDGKAYPFGPTCTFRGKTVPCFCCNSESGSINGSLLTSMLRYIDEKHVFDRTTGLAPFLLLDGHGSRFELEFLEYIHSDETKWTVNIGLPYGTSYWQVGDSTEQNGCFKMALTKGKQALVTQKNDNGLPFQINRTDIVKLVKDAWNVSFARVHTNQKAVLYRGWGPKALNKNALLSPEIWATKPASTDDPRTTKQGLQTSLPVSELNTNQGLAGTLIDRIVLESNREARLRGSSLADVIKKRQETAKKNLENHEKRCTAGLLASSGQFSLGVNVLEHQRRSKEIEEEKRIQKAARAKDIYDVLQAKVTAIREKNLPPEKWTVAELNTMLQWYKRPDNAAMPNKKADKLARYHEIKGRGDPPIPQLSAPQLQISPLPPLPGFDGDIVPLPLIQGTEDDSNDNNAAEDVSEPEEDDAAETLLLFAMEV
jgi:hypothetical protein